MLFITYLTIGLLKYLLQLPGFLQNTENLIPWIFAFPHVLLFLFVWRCYKSDRRSSLLGFSLLRNRLYLPVVVSSIALNLIVYVIYQMLVLSFAGSYLLVPEIPKTILGTGWFVPINLFAIVIWVPIIEEIFFRGFLLKEVAYRLGFPASILITSLIFSALHGEVGLLVPVFLNSVVISIVYIRFGSLVSVVMIHAIQNLIVTLVAASL